MVLIHPTEPFTGMAIAEETTWGTPVTTGFLSIPLVQPGETMALQREILTPVRVFSGSGYRESIEYGRSFVRGSFTMQGRYDGKAFNIMLAHSMFGEEVLPDTECYGGSTIAAANTGNTHIYRPGASVPKGLTIKVFKGGVGPTSAGYVETFAGCMVSSFTLEQTADQAPLWTFTFIGKATTNVLINAQTPTAIPAAGGSQLQKYRDLSTAPGYFKTGATLTALNIDGFRLTYDRKLEADPAFINAPDTVDQPGASDIRDVTFEINSRLEQEYAQANKPTNEYNAGIISKIDVVYSNAVAVGDKVYALRIEAPAVGWSTDQHSINDPANPPTRWTATAIAGTFDTTGGLPGNILTGDLRIMTTVKTADEPTAPDTPFSTVGV